MDQIGKGPVCLDTCVFIYYIEQHPSYIETVKKFLKPLMMVSLCLLLERTRRWTVNPCTSFRAQQYVQRKRYELLETFEITESSTRNKRMQFEKVINIISRSKQKIALFVIV